MRLKISKLEKKFLLFLYESRIKFLYGLEHSQWWTRWIRTKKILWKGYMRWANFVIKRIRNWRWFFLIRNFKNRLIFTINLNNNFNIYTLIFFRNRINSLITWKISFLKKMNNDNCILNGELMEEYELNFFLLSDKKAVEVCWRGTWGWLNLGGIFE